MKYSLAKISLDRLFKILLLIFIAYFLILLTSIAIQINKNSEVGRYQFHNDNRYILDTKSGEVRRYKDSLQTFSIN